MYAATSLASRHFKAKFIFGCDSSNSNTSMSALKSYCCAIVTKGGASATSRRVVHEPMTWQAAQLLFAICSPLLASPALASANAANIREAASIMRTLKFNVILQN